MANFELQTAINHWRTVMLRELKLNQQEIDELHDHLCCDIENRMKQGMSESVAFTCAVEQIKQHPLIADNYRCKSAIFDKIILMETGGNPSKQDYQNAKRWVAQSLLWAAAMIATALLVGDHPNAGYLSLFVLMPLGLCSVFALKK